MRIIHAKLFGNVPLQCPQSLKMRPWKTKQNSFDVWEWVTLFETGWPSYLFKMLKLFVCRGIGVFVCLSVSRHSQVLHVDLFRLLPLTSGMYC